MNRCERPCAPCDHTNAFVDLNGIPYLVGEYLDRRSFRQIDRSLIKSDIFVDTRESMRAIIDVSIDDIGKRASDGYPNIRGNNTKQRALLNMAASMAEQLNHQFDVLRKGIVMRVNYQLENQRTGHVIRSMVEDLRIPERFYFVDINPRDIDDNAVIVNFSNSLVSTITEFTHGHDPMVFRITTIQMFYECLRRDPAIPRIQQAAGPYAVKSELDYYNYHKDLQNRHVFGPNGCCYEGFGQEPPSAIMPPTWTMFNRYYHFDQDGHDIVLHHQEIYEPSAMCVLVPCGIVHVNRAFMINPGHRIIFKFSVWKNDLTVVSDALALAQAIQSPYMNVYQPQPPCDHWDPPGTTEYNPPHHCHHPTPPSRDPLIDEMKRNRELNKKQTEMINQLAGAVNSLIQIISTQHEGTETPEQLPPMEEPPQTSPPHCHHHTPVMDKLNELSRLLEDIKNKNNENCNDGCDHTEINRQIESLQREIEDIRTNGTDEAVADRLNDLSESITALSEQVNSETPQPIPEAKVNELVDKINNS